MDAESSSGGQPPPQEVLSPKSIDPAVPRRYDLVVIGSGRAAICAAREGARLGVRVALVGPDDPDAPAGTEIWAVEHALRQAARVAHQFARGSTYGFAAPEVHRVDFAGVMRQVEQVASRIARADSVGRVSELGVDVYSGSVTFTRPNALEVDGRQLAFRRAILATDSRGGEAEIDGRRYPDCLTPEKLPELTELPRSLAVLGGGPRLCQWAQIVRRLGSEVHLIAVRPAILPDHSPEVARLVERQFEEEGTRLHLACSRVSIERTGARWAVVIDRGGRKEKRFFDQVLLDRPREPNVARLRLDAARVAAGDRGVAVDDRLRTTNRRIYAAGGVCGQEFSSPEVAEAMARLCVHNALRRISRRFSRLIVPRCVLTDPEVVQLGLTPAEAAARQIDIDTYRAELAEVDRAVLEGREDGFVTVHTRSGSGHVVGATLVAEHARELAGPLALLIECGRSLDALCEMIPCRPTRFEVLRVIADRYRQVPKPGLWSRLMHGRRR